MAIAKQDFDRFMNQARIKLPGASDAGIKAELFDVMTEFFRDSSCWTEAISVPIIANTTTYSLTPAQDGQIISLAGVVDQNNIPQPAIMSDFGQFTLKYTPNSNQTFVATVCKNVTLPTTRDAIPVAPDWLFQQYHVTILDGLLGKMMAQPEKSYTSAAASQYHTRRFLDGTAMARVSAMRRHTFGTQAWSFPQGFRSRGQRGGVSVGNDTRFVLP